MDKYCSDFSIATYRATPNLMALMRPSFYHAYGFCRPAIQRRPRRLGLSVLHNIQVSARGDSCGRKMGRPGFSSLTCLRPGWDKLRLDSVASVSWGAYVGSLHLAWDSHRVMTGILEEGPGEWSVQENQTEALLAFWPNLRDYIVPFCQILWLKNSLAFPRFKGIDSTS